MSRRSARISPPVRESRLPVGSSANMIVGRETSARAIATRCCWPPESSDGRWPRRCVRPTFSVSSSHPLVVGLDAGEREREHDVLLRREHREQVEELEDEADVLAAQQRQVVVAESFVMSWPPIVTLPSVGRSRPARMCISVDLPEPEGPMTAVSWPPAMPRSTPRSALTASRPGRSGARCRWLRRRQDVGSPG